ncbi:isoprenylcysteine carboxylmethyltransferase family protein [Comamonas sp. NLF-1-9]|uniref:methyltransferase family protein n=1 Tax=Comamonas sp. NLF-1-9 TaxID=2853163 RepID=UPI001C468B4F|nr:isoprenylcysteine carboxylmethyltransferase family protein [Comamonas sp. NLF-1-9]QXL85042.1 isoprenylcysteine carboxylmethyltransferase family protein [Comamonas sp. NLF-1-9]
MTAPRTSPASWLDCKLPPVLVAALAGGLSWGVVQLTPMWTRLARSPWPLVLVLLALAGFFGLGAVAGFRRARTSVNPHAPARASQLVVAGPYRFTRNPMYLALALALLAWCAWLANPASLLGPLFFVAYITRWQIIPEERVMADKFGDGYRAYCTRVRRWF